MYHGELYRSQNILIDTHKNYTIIPELDCCVIIALMIMMYTERNYCQLCL